MRTMGEGQAVGVVHDSAICDATGELRARLHEQSRCVDVASELAAFALRAGFAQAIVLLDERRTGVLTIAAAGGASSVDRAQRDGLRLQAKDAGQHALLLQRFALEEASVLALLHEDAVLALVVAGRSSAQPPWPADAPRALESAKGDALAALRYCNLQRMHADGVAQRLSQQTILNEMVSHHYLELDELERARTFQSLMFAHTPRIPGLALESVYRPADAVSGDFYDICKTPTGLRLFVADATGHGVTAALVTMLLKAEYEGIKRAATTPHDVLVELNARLRSYKGEALAMSAVCLDLHIDSGVLDFASAAHPPVVVVREAHARELEFGGSLLGIADEALIVRARTEVRAGDGVYVYSDGLSEAAGAGGALFGESRVCRELAERHAGGEAAQGVVRSAEAFIRPLSFSDDVTIVGVRYGAP